MDKFDKFKYSNVIFYKPDEKPGWNVIKLYSNKKKIRKNCFEEYKERFGWKEYKVFSNMSVRYFEEEKWAKIKEANLKDEFAEFNDPAYEVHMRTDWIYRPELDKWFLNEKEEIPILAAECEITDELTVETFFEDGFNDKLINEPWEKSIAAVIFKTPQQKYLSRMRMKIHISMRYNFFRNIIRNNYACYIQDELSWDKFFAWNCGNKIRFSIQNYDGNKPKTVFDVLIDKNLLIDKLEKQVDIMETEIPKIKKDPARYPFCEEFGYNDGSDNEDEDF